MPPKEEMAISLQKSCWLRRKQAGKVYSGSSIPNKGNNSGSEELDSGKGAINKIFRNILY